MEKVTNEDIKVFGRVVSVSTEGIVADAEQIWDSKQGMNQQATNEQLLAFKRAAEQNLSTTSDTANKIAALEEKLTWFEASVPVYHP